MAILDQENIDRMEGLHNYKDMEAFQTLYVKLTRQLVDEGWEEDEVKEFMQIKIEQALENIP